MLKPTLHDSDICSMKINVIGAVSSERTEVIDDHWGDVLAKIQLISSFDVTLFREKKYAYFLFYMDKVEDEKIVRDARHPRNDPDLPLTGIFAQRAKNRPNKIGLSRAKIIDIQENALIVQGLDAINGTPILAIKPWITDCEPTLDSVKEAPWLKGVMKNYFLSSLSEENKNLEKRLQQLNTPKITLPSHINLQPLGHILSHTLSNKRTIVISDPAFNASAFVGLEMFSHIYVLYTMPNSKVVDFVIAKTSNTQSEKSNENQKIKLEVIADDLPMDALILDVKPYSTLFFPTL